MGIQGHLIQKRPFQVAQGIMDTAPGAPFNIEVARSRIVVYNASKTYGSYSLHGSSVKMVCIYVGKEQCQNRKRHLNLQDFSVEGGDIVATL